MRYAILNAEGQCVNRILWDGISPWNPPEGCRAVPDPDNSYPNLISSLTTEEESTNL
jgi:hypothetical protein